MRRQQRRRKQVQQQREACSHHSLPCHAHDVAHHSTRHLSQDDAIASLEEAAGPEAAESKDSAAPSAT